MYSLTNLRESSRAMRAAAAAISAAAAACATYALVYDQLEKEFADLASKEIEEAKVFYASINKESQPDPEALFKQLHPEEAEQLRKAAEALTTYQGKSPAQEETDDPRPPIEEIEEHNVFEDRDDWDQEAEETLRAELAPGAPYIISKDEFLQNDPGYDQKTITYYSEDDVLADERDAPIPDIESIVGDAVDQFGKGSGDLNTVFVRNDRIELDFEIVHSDISFAQSIMGFKHSDQRTKIRKFRGDYD